MKALVGGLLLVHGFITAALSAGSFDAASEGVPNPAWLRWPAALGKSWLLALLPRARAAALEPIIGAIWLLAGIAIVAAALGLFGFLVPVGYWRMLAGIGAVISLVLIAIYAHPFYAVGLAANIAILVVLLWMSWPSVQVLGS